MICITRKQVQLRIISNGIVEETSHLASNIDMAEQQPSSSVSANKIGGHIFNDVNETNIAIKKSILTISDKSSRCVAEWVDVDLALFVCPVLNPIVQINRQNKIRYTFKILSDKSSRCVAEWVDVDLALFICPALNPIVQINRQNKIRYTFKISDCDEIFDILVLEKRIRIPVDRDISSLGKCAYCK
jgi:hypothetical protein